MTIVLVQHRGLFVSSPLRTGLTADFLDLWCYLIDWTWIVYIFYSSGFVWMVDFTNSAPFKGVCLSVSLIDLPIPPPFKEVFLSVCWIDLPIAPPFKWVYLSVCWIDCTNNATFQWCLFFCLLSLEWTLSFEAGFIYLQLTSKCLEEIVWCVLTSLLLSSTVKSADQFLWMYFSSRAGCCGKQV